jgi:hypothetical protein
MHVIARLLPARPSLGTIAVLTFVAGAAGMVVSFAFLASNHPLDVTAGAAGFIAGSVFIAASLVSLSLQRRTAPVDCPPTPATVSAAVPEPPLDVPRWVAHFQANHENRPEPDWDAPITLPPEVIAPLLRSLEQFQLGDGGGPAYLIARNREEFLAQDEGTRQLVDLWFAEEREHARLLGEAVARFGGTCITKHWSFTAFCATRKWFGVRFELTVLLLTEIVSTVYYRMLLRHANDPALRAMCRLILRDEIGHVSFHRDRLARLARAGTATFGRLWAIRFRLLGLAAATMLWANHAPGLKAVGVTRRTFYRAIQRELSLFIARLRNEAIVSTTSAGTINH